MPRKFGAIRYATTTVTVVDTECYTVGDSPLYCVYTSIKVRVRQLQPHSEALVGEEVSLHSL